jgi:ethanolamine utilization microcompartment shell protein EutS
MKQQQALESFLAGRRVVLAKFVAHHYKEVSNKAKKVVGIVNLY